LFIDLLVNFAIWLSNGVRWRCEKSFRWCETVKRGTRNVQFIITSFNSNCDPEWKMIWFVPFLKARGWGFFGKCAARVPPENGHEKRHKNGHFSTTFLPFSQKGAARSSECTISWIQLSVPPCFPKKICPWQGTKSAQKMLSVSNNFTKKNQKLTKFSRISKTLTFFDF